MAARKKKAPTRRVIAIETRHKVAKSWQETPCGFRPMCDNDSCRLPRKGDSVRRGYRGTRGRSG